MNCKHKYEPTNFGIKYRKPNSYWWSCIRCGNTIFSELLGALNESNQQAAVGSS